jgi:hypothetical protein
LAQAVFKDVFAIERIDDRHDYRAQRVVIIGMAKGNSCCLSPPRRANSVFGYFSAEGDTR